jgi:tetrahydromethanopterin S-methyltransferase subunit E
MTRLEVRAAGQAKAMLRTLHDHDDWNAGARGETPMQRADRAYGEILQEVRVAQTGVQILFAFLLALAFQARFPAITSFQRGVYVVTLLLCAAATALLIAPAAFHRMIYRKRLKQHLVRVANRMAITGLALLLLSMVSAVLLIMDVVLGLVPALVLVHHVVVRAAAADPAPGAGGRRPPPGR